MTTEDYNKAVDTYSDGVYRFILKNIRNTDKAKDIVQDTFEKLWINVKNVNSEKVKSYIFTTAYHTMIDSIRKNKRIVNFEQADQSEYSTNRSYSDVGEILNKAIAKLPEDQRSVILLRDYEGYSYDEISEITGLTEAQVKVYIYRARVFLKEYIGSMSVLV
ncbi:MAG: RNA polymerase sigma factor [Bacteroidia bacterium]|nr:RNA polymerase sigma factor [Bacteroidia bacterium]